jgi:hypothetical protein
MQALEDARVARQQATQEAAKEAANRERALLDEREVLQQEREALQQEREALQQELRGSVEQLRVIDAANAALDFESQVRRIKINSDM